MEKRTAKENELLMKHLHNNEGSLYEAYTKPSHAKVVSWEAIEQQQRELNGHGLKVNTFNTFMYTCSFEYTNKNGQRTIKYHTPSNEYDIVVS